MGVLHTLTRWMTTPGRATPRYRCEECGSVYTAEDEECPTCGGRLAELEQVPAYDWGPMY